MKDEELQNRRDFFKKVAKTTLPILSGLLLASHPTVAKAAKKSLDFDKEMQCYCYGCVGGCDGGCYSCCVGECRYTCLGSCNNTCRNTCIGSCHTTCSGGCTGMAYFWAWIILKITDGIGSPVRPRTSPSSLPKIANSPVSIATS